MAVCAGVWLVRPAALILDAGPSAPRPPVLAVCSTIATPTGRPAGEAKGRLQRRGCTRVNPPRCWGTLRPMPLSSDDEPRSTPMGYQVLARKWRPRFFADLVGQEHVVRALSNALERGQLHHAYLFTGTRGVGKTTLARILAKALNCEQGVSAEPCGTCSSCREVDEGRFVDLLEVDAASRTKVDQTRELLDNVPFAPVRGRYKVYLIDEVHMFSPSSFNALLKTLEEPPPHVKFVLATTDPQKLPATVLSRCLQFNLKRLLPGQIQGQFQTVLNAEGIEFDEVALALLAHAADGSMRDGLSLLDQAIAFGGGRVGGADVRTMLGTRGGDLVLDLLDALGRGDAGRVLAEVGRIAELTPDFGGVLRDLLALLHRIALAQQLPGTLDDDDPDRGRVLELAQGIAPEDVQLYYQVLLIGQQDLPLAPEPRTGLEMVLLRALAFRPATEGPHPDTRASVGASPAGRRGDSPHPDAAAGPPETPRPAAARPAPATAHAERPPAADAGELSRPAPAPAARVAAAPDGALASTEDWHALVARMDLGGLEGQLAHHCAFVDWNGERVRLSLDPSVGHLRVAGAEQRLGAALAVAMGRAVTLDIQVAKPEMETPAARRARNDAARQRQAEQAMQDDPLARELQERFDAQWVPGSIRATD